MVLATLLLSQHVMAQFDLYVSVNQAGTLEETVGQISATAKYNTPSMKVMGPLNGKDMMFIREMCGVSGLSTPTQGILRILDISETYIMETDEVYINMLGRDMVTHDDRFGSGFLYNCVGLEQLYLPESIISIDSLALAGCSHLKYVEIPPTVQSIEYGAFVDCASLTSLILPHSVENVGEGAFQRMTSLEELTLGDNVVGLDNSALLGDSRLNTINVGNAFQSFNPVTFYNTPALTNINVSSGNPFLHSIEGVLFNNDVDTLLAFPPASMFTEYQVPEGIKCIAPFAFCNSSIVKSVFMPTSLETVDTLAFYDCASLADVHLNDGLKTIAFGAFGGRSSLQGIAIPSSVNNIEGGAFLLNSSLANIQVGAENFFYCVGDDGWLYDAKKEVLCHVPSMAEFDEFPAHVRIVGPYAMAGMAKSPRVALGDNVKKISDGAFAYSSFSQITLGKGVSEIGDRVVDGCAHLRAVYCFPTSLDDDKIEELAFYDESGEVANYCTLFVHPGSLSYFQNKKGFSANGLSFFNEVRELQNADGIEQAEREGLAGGLHVYDAAGRATGNVGRGLNILRRGKGKAIKSIVR